MAADSCRAATACGYPVTRRRADIAAAWARLPPAQRYVAQRNDGSAQSPPWRDTGRNRCGERCQLESTAGSQRLGSGPRRRARRDGAHPLPASRAEGTAAPTAIVAAMPPCASVHGDAPAFAHSRGHAPAYGGCGVGIRADAGCAHAEAAAAGAGVAAADRERRATAGGGPFGKRGYHRLQRRRRTTR